MGENNTLVSAYTLYRQLQQYCSHPSICSSTCASRSGPKFCTFCDAEQYDYVRRHMYMKDGMLINDLSEVSDDQYNSVDLYNCLHFLSGRF